VHAGQLAGGSPVGLQPGDELTLNHALYAALLASDNVAAESLATFVGYDLLRRRGKPGAPPQEFVFEMNALAQGKLNMRSTKFVNPHGLDYGLKKPPHSTAADMARLTRYAMDKEALQFIVEQQKRSISINRFGKKLTKELRNTNSLLGKSQIDGVKTGQTQAAGPCLIISAKKSNLVTTLPNGDKRVQKRRLNVIVLGAADRFRSAKALLDWGWREYDGWNAAGRPMADANGAL
jgi:D-alanyl-D-alanine carboxypeptidase